MPPRLAARKIKTLPHQVRRLIAQGKIKATKRQGRYGLEYDVSERAIADFLRQPRRVKNAKINRQIADEIRLQYATGLILQKDLAAKYGLSRSSICLILARKKWAS